MHSSDIITDIVNIILFLLVPDQEQKSYWLNSCQVIAIIKFFRYVPHILPKTVQQRILFYNFIYGLIL